MSREVIIPKAQFFKTHIEGANRNTGLDMARAISVLAIFLAHTNNYAGAFTGIYPYIRCFPVIMQELFFALSGFLVGHQIIKYIKPEDPFRGLFGFYRNRWTRTIPFYFIFLVINYSIFYTVYRHSSFRMFENTSFSLFDYFSFTQNLYSPHPIFFPEIWSVPIEEWSFLLLPIPVLIFVISLRKTLSTKSLLGLLVLIIAIVTAFRIYYVIQADPELDWELRKIVVYRLDALLYGFGIRVLIDRYSAFFTKAKLWFLLTGLVISFGFYFSKPFLPLTVYKALIFSLVPMGMGMTLPYFYLGNFTGLPNRLKSVLTHISLTSYAILLSHLYFIQFSMLVIYTPQNLLECVLFTLVYTAIVIGFSTLFFNYVEQPVLMRRKKFIEVQ